MDRMAKIIAVGEAEHEVTARRAAEAERAAVVAFLRRRADNAQTGAEQFYCDLLAGEFEALAHLESKP